MVSWNALLWLYLINAVLLILHEMDSAYWREWRLFKLPGAMTGFLLLHVPLLGLLLYGLLLLERQASAGLLFSIVVSAGGLFAFGIHTYFLKHGHAEFNVLISKVILGGTLVVSLLQAAATIAVFMM